MTVHDLKTWPDVFEATLDGRKTFEVRKNDRKFKLGDTLWLREWDPERERYTGRHVTVEVRYLLEGGRFGLPEELCVMAVELYKSREPEDASELTERMRRQDRLMDEFMKRYR